MIKLEDLPNLARFLVVASILFWGVFLPAIYLQKRGWNNRLLLLGMFVTPTVAGMLISVIAGTATWARLNLMLNVWLIWHIIIGIFMLVHYVTFYAKQYETNRMTGLQCVSRESITPGNVFYLIWGTVSLMYMSTLNAILIWLPM